MPRNKRRGTGVVAEDEDVMVEEGEDEEDQEETPRGAQLRQEAVELAAERKRLEAEKRQLAKDREELAAKRQEIANRNMSKFAGEQSQADEKKRRSLEGNMVDLGGEVCTYGGKHYGPGVVEAPDEETARELTRCISRVREAKAKEAERIQAVAYADANAAQFAAEQRKAALL